MPIITIAFVRDGASPVGLVTSASKEGVLIVCCSGGTSRCCAAALSSQKARNADALAKLLPIMGADSAQQRILQMILSKLLCYHFDAH